MSRLVVSVLLVLTACSSGSAPTEVSAGDLELSGEETAGPAGANDPLVSDSAVAGDAPDSRSLLEQVECELPGPFEESPPMVWDAISLTHEAYAVSTAGQLLQAIDQDTTTSSTMFDGTLLERSVPERHREALELLGAEQKVLTSGSVRAANLAFEDADGSVVWLDYCYTARWWTDDYADFVASAESAGVELDGGLDALISYLSTHTVAERAGHASAYFAALDRVSQEADEAEWLDSPPDQRFIAEGTAPQEILDQLDYMWRLLLVVPESWYGEDTTGLAVCVHLDVGLSECSSLHLEPGLVPITTWLPRDGSNVEFWLVDSGSQLNKIGFIGRVGSTELLEARETLTGNDFVTVDFAHTKTLDIFIADSGTEPAELPKATVGTQSR